jgi:uncharacterized protein YjiS (DUF1127 family)
MLCQHFQTELESAMPAITALTIAAAVRARLGLKRLVERVRSRYDAMRLAELDDRMLADIGLNRGDLRDAYALPPWRDAGGLLARRVAERRGSRRRPEPACVGVPTLTSELFGTPPIPCRRPDDRPAPSLNRSA